MARKFSKTQFYSAKQDDNCQWYGILNAFDIVRKNYTRINTEVLSAFSTVTIQKVIAIVHGTGGCGKSTVLRRLALELSQESDCEIIWIKDRQLETFVVNALPRIQADIRNKYLVFVEDWYRLTDQKAEVGKSLLNTTQAISNIRLVIGDRDVIGKDYEVNLIKPENSFKLSEKENRAILDAIIATHTEWKDASELVLKTPESCNAPLFLILFVIAGIAEKRLEKMAIEFNDVENAPEE